MQAKIHSDFSDKIAKACTSQGCAFYPAIVEFYFKESLHEWMTKSQQQFIPFFSDNPEQTSLHSIIINLIQKICRDGFMDDMEIIDSMKQTLNYNDGKEFAFFVKTFDPNPEGQEFNSTIEETKEEIKKDFKPKHRG